MADNNFDTTPCEKKRKYIIEVGLCRRVNVFRYNFAPMDLNGPNARDFILQVNSVDYVLFKQQMEALLEQY